jgi:general stress protein 26
MAHLATASSAGAPHVSKVWPVVDGDVLWVFTRQLSGKVRRIAGNPQVALMFEANSETYLYGTATLVHDQAEKQRLWARTDLPFDPAMFFGSADHPDHVLVRITPQRAIVTTHDANGFVQRTWTAE